MNLAKWALAIKLATLVLSIFALVRAYQQLKRFPDLRKRAVRKFREASIPANVSNLAFDGGSAEIVLVETTGVDHQTFTCAIYARNPAGEYFLFRSSASGQSIKHIEPRIAKLVLKERFIEPKGSAN